MIDVILPALNESAAIPRVVAAFPDGFRPIVVDNGSTDDTAQVAAAVGARVVYEPVRGFGAACAAGLGAATTELVCFMDCDGSLDAGDLPRVCEPIARGAADLVMGARRPQSRRAWPKHAQWANATLARIVQSRTGLRVSDVGPMRAARRRPLLALEIVDRRFGWPLEMVLRASRAGWRIDEVPVAYAPRIGRSKVTGTVTGTARAVLDMAKVLR